MKKRSIISHLLTIVLFLTPFIANATIGDNGIHDPSTIIEHNGVYHVFGTGHGDPENGVPVQTMVHKTSTDLVNWTNVQPVWTTNQIPSWIYNYVPNFGGIFWAPDIININGTYHLYYAASMGDRESAIGVATSTDLYNWTDQGMVIHSESHHPYGSIDPAVFRGADNSYWMTFGSHLSGIWISEINPNTGKRPANATLTNIAGGVSWIDYEASYMIFKNGYYYLFFTQGACCRLMESTYRVLMGRSQSPRGPFVDKNGVSLVEGGQSLILGTTGRFIGPGHFGLLQEGGKNLISLHYYDGNSNGYPRLDIVEMRYGADGWPFVTRDLVPDGKYKITNLNSGMAMATNGCNARGPVIQDVVNNNSCQEWNLTSVGNGYYRLGNAASTTQPEQVVDLPNCSVNSNLATYDWLNNNCQKFRILPAANGRYVFSSRVNDNMVIGVPSASTAAGAPVATGAYEGSAAQQWNISQGGGAPIVSGGTYQIIPRHSNKALDVENCGSGTGTNVRQWSWLNNDCQKWILIDVGGGSWRISPAHASGLVLDVANCSGANLANVQLWNWLNNDCQKWELVSTGDGFFNIRSRASGKSLDVNGKSSADGANVSQYTYNGGFNQQFRLQPVNAYNIAAVDESQESGLRLIEEAPEPLHSLTIFPNPVLNKVTIQTPAYFEEETTSVTFVNTVGVIVGAYQFSGNEYSIDWSDKTPGIYFVKLQNGTHSISGKLIK